MPNVVKAYDPKLRVQLVFPAGEGRTKQSFKDECDVNKIMARFTRTGVLDFASKFSPRYEDVTGADFQSAMDTVARANSMFQELPAELRRRFKNDPVVFLDFVDDPANADKARELGLLPPLEAKVVPPAEPAPVPSPAPAPAAKPASAGA